MVNTCLTVKSIGSTGIFFVGHSDPKIQNGMVFDQQLKGTVGITG